MRYECLFVSKLPLAVSMSIACTLVHGESKPLSLAAEVTYLSKYIGHGFDFSNDGPVVQSTVYFQNVFIDDLELIAHIPTRWIGMITLGMRPELWCATRVASF